MTEDVAPMTVEITPQADRWADHLPVPTQVGKVRAILGAFGAEP